MKNTQDPDCHTPAHENASKRPNEDQPSTKTKRLILASHCKPIENNNHSRKQEDASSVLPVRGRIKCFYWDARQVGSLRKPFWRLTGRCFCVHIRPPVAARRSVQKQASLHSASSERRGRSSRWGGRFVRTGWWCSGTAMTIMNTYMMIGFCCGYNLGPLGKWLPTSRQGRRSSSLRDPRPPQRISACTQSSLSFLSSSSGIDVCL